MMKRAMLSVVVVVALAACGGKVDEVSGTSSSGSVPTGTATSVPPSPPSTGQPPAPSPTKPPPTTTKTITAQAQPGGRNHLLVFAADAVADSCLRVHLAWPSSNSTFPNILTPKEWGVEDISRSPGAARCGPGKQPPAAETATDAKGTIAFASSASHAFPCSIDVHVIAVFGGTPTTEQVDGDKIAVAGCQ